jgi:Uma2 family endonuclease
MTSVLEQLQTDIWVKASWDEYIQTIEDPAAKNLRKSRGYYYAGKMRIEAMPIGSDHADAHAILLLAVSLFAIVKNFALTTKDNCSYRKVGIAEFQPDLSYYAGEKAAAIPKGTRIINLDVYPLPDLVVEIADTTLADDQGEKRLQYESLGIPEYWIVNVQTCEILAFAIANQGSRRIQESIVLPGLAIDLLQQTLERSQAEGQTAASTWLLEQLRA